MKVIAKEKPVATLLIGLFIIYKLVLLTQLALSDLVSHPGYVTVKAAIVGLGLLIWLNALKTGKFGMAALQYIGFLVLASLVQFIAFAASYGETTSTGMSTGITRSMDGTTNINILST